MDFEEIRKELEEFGQAAVKAMQSNLCALTKSRADRVINLISHPDDLNESDLVDLFADIGKSILKKYIE